MGWLSQGAYGMLVLVCLPGIAPAPALLAPWFADVTLLRYDDGLVVKEVEPLVAYVASVSGWLDEDGLAALRHLAAGKLARDGAIRLTKDTSLLVGHRRARRN